MFRGNLNKIVQGNDLSETEMSQMITEIFSGNVTDAQIGALMAALATKEKLLKNWPERLGPCAAKHSVFKLQPQPS